MTTTSGLSLPLLRVWMGLYRSHLEAIAMRLHEGLVYAQAHRLKGQIPLMTWRRSALSV